MSKKRDLYVAKSFDELTKVADKTPYSRDQLNDLAICSTILKLYDEGMKAYNGEYVAGQIDEERSYILLMRFVDMCLKMRKSKLYKDDKGYIDGMLSEQKMVKCVKLLESLKSSLVERYEAVKDKETKEAEAAAEAAKAIAEKLFINANELRDMIINADLKLLIIDVRSQTEFDFAHLNFEYFKEYDENRVFYMNIPPEMIEDCVVVWKFEQKFDEKSLELFKKRSIVDHVILFDTNTSEKSYKMYVENSVETSLSHMKRALFTYDTSEDKVKNEPIILDGGWMEWIRQFPVYKKCTEKPIEPLKQLSNNEINEIKESIMKFVDEKKSNIDEIQSQQPQLLQPQLLIQPQIQPQSLQPQRVSSSDNTIVNRKPSVPSVNRANKPAVYRNPLAPVNLTSTTFNDIGGNDGPLFPDLDPIKKKQEAKRLQQEIQAREAVKLIETDESEEDNEMIQPNEEPFIHLNEQSSLNHVESQAKLLTNRTVTVIPSTVQPQLPSKSNILTQQDTNLIARPVVYSQNIEPSSVLIQPNPNDPLTAMKIVPTVPQIQPINRPDIYHSVYRPTTYAARTRIQTPMMKDGVYKVLNPVTGMFSYVYDKENKISYSVSGDIPQNLMSNEPHKDVQIDLKDAKPAAIPQQQQPQIPKQPTVTPTSATNITPNITALTTTTIPVPKQSAQIKKQNIPSNSGGGGGGGGGLKRVLSQPNIAKLNEIDDDLNKYKDNEVKNDVNFKSTTSATTVTPAAASKPVQPSQQQPLQIVKKQSDEPKPNINRNVKPMPENIRRARLDDLQPVWTNVHPGLTGIRNLGNTCFMNSIIQCLSNTMPLKEYFTKDVYYLDINRTNPLGFGGEIADEFSIIMYALWWGRLKVIAPRRFKAIIGQFNSQFLSNEQQDAQEFLLFLLDGLHEDLNKILQRPKNLEEINYDEIDDFQGAKIAWSHHLKLNNSIIVDLFHGQFKSTVMCMTCEKASNKFEAFMYLTLPVPTKRCALYDCVRLFLRPEKMSGESKWKCPDCKQLRDAVKKIDIWELPPLLIIHLKRFQYQGVWRDKISVPVDFPIDSLELGEYVASNVKRTSYKYKLYAISNHTGTLDGGHYTAYCKNYLLNHWFKYDDSEVKEVNLSTIKSPSAYILFYSRF